MANYSTLQMGSSGQDVEKLQNALINAGYDLEGGADGVFGSKTDAALREYQKANGLTVDGVAGDATLVALGINASGSAAMASLSTELPASATSRCSSASGMASFSRRKWERG